MSSEKEADPYKTYKEKRHARWLTLPEAKGVEEMCLSAPLYVRHRSAPTVWSAPDRLGARVAIQPTMKDQIFAYEDLIDAYCHNCRQTVGFRGMAVQDARSVIGGTCFTKRFECTRVDGHQIWFGFVGYDYEDPEVVKWGQYPSMADLAEAVLGAGVKRLPAKYHREYVRALRLYAHDVPLGAFVYLRRVFERLIEDAHLRALAAQPQWDEELYRKSRMDERIALVASELPEFVVQHRGIYKVLSKGIHEMEEEECAQLFPLVHSSIELILAEEVRRTERDVQLKKAQDQLAAIQAELRTRDSE